MSSNYPATTNNLFGIANRALTEALNTRSLIVNTRSRTRVKQAKFDHEVGKPNTQPPPAFSDLFAGGDSTSTEIVRLNGEADEWIQKYFPSIGAGINKSLPEDFLLNVISGVKPFGLDETVFERIWHKARDRAYRAQTTESKTLAATFSGAGFTLAPGAMVAALTESEQRASLAIAAVNIEQAVKEAEIKLELLKFAEEQAINLKLGLMRSMADFYRMWFAMPDRDLERARVRAQAMGTFYQALSSYHNVEVAFERLNLETEKAGADIDVQNARIALDASNDFDANLSALGQAASAFANVASGAASAAGTLVAEVENL
ncbi:hypothetical protein SAMN05216206_2748 [Pseudomonas guineae]|uniref:Uncharacterized protein n=1 Tax=Pseudomonas guineae TaxID=425504 RepID=A0A1I3K8D3_9PSED|nr:hypothetical protein [Pseudomonas guineae]SFI68749.1 hypothetical protein SAMN05216206_2748 [Pseudomonas guineae]